MLCELEMSRSIRRTLLFAGREMLRTEAFRYLQSIQSVTPLPRATNASNVGSIAESALVSDDDELYACVELPRSERKEPAGSETEAALRSVVTRLDWLELAGTLDAGAEVRTHAGTNSGFRDGWYRSSRGIGLRV